MKISEGKITNKVKGMNRTSIIDISFDNKYTIFVFQGTRSKNDIIIKYKEGNKKIRTPRHIHWVVDLLLKLQSERSLTRELIKEIENEWNRCKPLNDNDSSILTTLVNNSTEITDIKKYNKLNKYGEYEVEFLIVLLSLLMVQEKTDDKDAYMFGKILSKLLEDELDIFSIMSASGYSGRH